MPDKMSFEHGSYRIDFDYWTNKATGFQQTQVSLHRGQHPCRSFNVDGRVAPDEIDKVMSLIKVHLSGRLPF